MRIAVIHVGQETNDFNKLPTTTARFAAFGLYERDEVLRRMHGLGQVGGCIDAVAEAGLAVEWVPIISGWALAGGRLDREARLFFEERIGTGLREAGRIDALALHLHGACAAEGVDDVEGAQLGICRAVLGPEVPIVVSLDHHANVTEQMVRLSTAIVGHRTQPHDLYDTGRLAGEMLVRILRDGARPVMAWRKLRMITHQEQFLTASGPMKTWFDQARAMEADPRVLQVVPCPMQPWLDVAEAGWATIVVTDNDRPLAERLADESADLAWAMRDDFMVREAVAIDDGVRMADAAERGVVVLSDTGDTVFGGAAGDSNLILESILRLGIKSRALMPLVEPQTVARLVQAGEGAEVTLEVGGGISGYFRPLRVTGRVRRIADGRVRVKLFQQPEFDQGRTVVFETGPVTLLVSEGTGAGGNVPDVYRFFGLEPTEYKMAVLKTASNFQFFAPISSRVIRMDTSGPGQSDVAGLPWKRVPRPIFPLDPIGGWRG
ncbi:MAG: microcystin degradation protein MlrC [Rhodospirillales bacterium 70-18]|nr:M81 family metallopeptidase [Rhodospirillales bacterium]OJY73067.1 MAG: microcystin degradation protein MlrC [Rhodospirillales bacterium 70-18]